MASWRNIQLIYLREMRDQLRDRRTMFMVAVLPLLLYPVLGFNWAQMAQLMQPGDLRILVTGAEHLPEHPRAWFLDDATRQADAAGAKIQWATEDGSIDQQQSQQLLGGVDAVLNVQPPDHGSATPRLSIWYNGSRDRSVRAARRALEDVGQWRQELTRDLLADQPQALAALEPFALVAENVAGQEAQASLWPKILPFVLLIWALTGAFYPAVDLCAGEKERGTLETLLCSPARRGEIVWGKLLTIMTFSAATSLLNLGCMAATGMFLVRQLHANGAGFQLPPPPLAAMGWLVLGVLPIAALFSALALAIAAFARSSREGQYYLMPLLLINMPMMMLPLTMDLNWGISLAPVAGLLLLLKALLEGDYASAALHFPVVAAVTLACCWLSIRWAESQFNKESVLFRECERWSWSQWLRKRLTESHATPSAAEALFCGALLLAIRFFGSMGAVAPETWSGFVILSSITQLALIAAPALLMTVALGHRPKATLALGAPTTWLSVPVCMLLAVVLHPVAVSLGALLQMLYPLSEATRLQLQPISQLLQEAPWWQALLVIALTPAICEELAFRGFILGGLRRLGGSWPAIAISSVFFGLAHGVLQQSISAGLLGLVLGYIVIHCKSIWPAMGFHFVHNGMTLALSRADNWMPTALRHMTPIENPLHIYHWTLVAAGILAAVLLMKRMPSVVLGS